MAATLHFWVMKRAKRVLVLMIPPAIILFLIAIAGPSSIPEGTRVPEVFARPSWILIWVWFMPSGLGTLLGAALGLGGIAIAAYYAFRRVVASQDYQAELQRTAFEEQAGQQREALAQQAELQRQAFETQAQLDRDRIAEEQSREGRAVANALSVEFAESGRIAVAVAHFYRTDSPDSAISIAGQIETSVYQANLGRLGLLDAEIAQRAVSTSTLLRIATPVRPSRQPTQPIFGKTNSQWPAWRSADKWRSLRGASGSRSMRRGSGRRAGHMSISRIIRRLVLPSRRPAPNPPPQEGDES